MGVTVVVAVPCSGGIGCRLEDMACVIVCARAVVWPRSLECCSCFTRQARFEVDDAD